jgi:hypothetical protein
MLRLALLTALLSCLLATTASAARTIPASSWSGKLIVVTDSWVHDEQISEGEHDLVTADGRHVMSGRIEHLLLPRKRGERSSWLGGAGSLEQLSGSVKAFHSNENAFRSLEWNCSGALANNGNRDATLQFRTEIGYSYNLKLMVDGLFLHPKETCDREGFESPIHLDGWPEDWVFPTPAAPHASRKLELQSDWWRFYENCGEGSEREGSGAPPGVVRESFGDEQCISGHVTRIHTLLDLKRKCSYVNLRVSGSSARERCVKR